jgi:hypothetical protein
MSDDDELIMLYVGDDGVARRVAQRTVLDLVVAGGPLDGRHVSVTVYFGEDGSAVNMTFPEEFYVSFPEDAAVVWDLVVDLAKMKVSMSPGHGQATAGSSAVDPRPFDWQNAEKP